MSNSYFWANAGSGSRGSVDFEYRAGNIISTWTMERDHAVAHAARVLFLAGVSDMHIGADGDVTYSFRGV